MQRTDGLLFPTNDFVGKSAPATETLVVIPDSTPVDGDLMSVADLGERTDDPAEGPAGETVGGVTVSMTLADDCAVLLAESFNESPAVDAVVVGGFGRAGDRNEGSESATMHVGFNLDWCSS